MASIVTPTVLHVPTGYVIDRTNIVHMDVVQYLAAHCLAIALSVLIQFTASDVSFHIFKRFPTVIMALLQLKTFET
jgi:hypothetical protein